jgi:hypothetical protein
MKIPRSRIRLAALLCAAAALAALAGAGTGGESATLPAEAVPAAVAEKGAEVARADRAPLDGFAEPGRAFQEQPLPEARDAFVARSWLPPPVAQKPAAPPKPVAPPLPFAYIGRMEEDGKITVYLRRGEDVVLAQAGKAVDAAYQLEEVTADQLVFLYVPLRQQQVLSLGAVR